MRAPENSSRTDHSARRRCSSGAAGFLPAVTTRTHAWDWGAARVSGLLLFLEAVADADATAGVTATSTNVCGRQHLQSGLNTKSNLVFAGENPWDQIPLVWFPCNGPPSECLWTELLLKASCLSVHKLYVYSKYSPTNPQPRSSSTTLSWSLFCISTVRPLGSGLLSCDGNLKTSRMYELRPGAPQSISAQWFVFYYTVKFFLSVIKSIFFRK